MEPFIIMESSKINETRCAVIGFGSSGNCVIDLMESKKNSNIEFIRRDEDIEQIKEKLQGVDIVFVTGGLGGHTGRICAPIIAKIAKDAGALTIGVITKPFTFEGDERIECAENSIQELTKIADSVIVVPNKNRFAINIPKLKNSERLKTLDHFLENIIWSMIGVIHTMGESDITLDFRDFKTVLSHQGIAVAGFSGSWGTNAAYNAINLAIEMASISIENASGILVHFTMHPEFDFMKLSEGMEVIQKNVAEATNVIFGTTTDETLPIDSIQVVLVATGFEKRHIVPANNVF